jgi:protein-tyrosine phosphatase
MVADAARHRSLGLRGLSNARDLGGLPAAGGREIAFRRLYRAELLVGPEAEGISSRWMEEDGPGLIGLGVRTVIDLRGGREAGAAPSAWAEATGADRVLSFPIEDGGHGAARDYVDMLLTGRLKQFTGEHLGDHYVNVLEAKAETFAEAVCAIAEGSPTLIHCTEGKDRTGLLVALVLGALGTPDADIIEDYALTSLWRPDRAAAYAPPFEDAGLSLEDFRVLYESPASAMRRALTHLTTEYGGVRDYLRERGGMPEVALTQLSSTLLEPADVARQAAAT